MVTTANMRLLPNIINSETDQRSVQLPFASARKGSGQFSKLLDSCRFVPYSLSCIWQIGPSLLWSDMATSLISWVTSTIHRELWWNTSCIRIFPTSVVRWVKMTALCHYPACCFLPHSYPSCKDLQKSAPEWKCVWLCLTVWWIFNWKDATLGHTKRRRYFHKRSLHKRSSHKPSSHKHSLCKCPVISVIPIHQECRSLSSFC